MYNFEAIKNQTGKIVSDNIRAAPAEPLAFLLTGSYPNL